MAIHEDLLHYRNRINEHLSSLPFYVKEFYEDKKNDYSARTLLQYIYQIKGFLTWLSAEGIVNVNSLSEIHYKILEELPKDVVKTYFDKLKEENISRNTSHYHVYEQRKDISVNNAKSALRSFFRYLAVETEDQFGNSYIDRNVMEKFPLKKIKVSPVARAAEINKKIFKDNQIRDFLNFVKYEYIEMIADNPRMLGPFNRDKERDNAILNLFLGSGIRLSELASLEINNIDFIDCSISIVRKGEKHENIPITIDSLLAIEEYLKVRNTKYKGAEHIPFLFVSNHGGVKCMSHRAIENLVVKYTKAFLQKEGLSQYSSGITPHKLRHSFALKYWETNKDMKLLAEQLGHSNYNTTALYVNMSDQKRHEAMERVSKDLNGEK